MCCVKSSTCQTPTRIGETYIYLIYGKSEETEETERKKLTVAFACDLIAGVDLDLVLWAGCSVGFFPASPRGCFVNLFLPFPACCFVAFSWLPTSFASRSCSSSCFFILATRLFAISALVP